MPNLGRAFVSWTRARRRAGHEHVPEEMIMRFHKLRIAEFAKAGGVGVVTALLLTAVMVPAMKFGLSPMPKALGLAFAETVLGRALPLPVGLLFHIAYIAFWFDHFRRPVARRPESDQSASSRRRAVGRRVGGVLSRRRMGLPGTRDQPEIDRRVVRPPCSLRGVSLGLVPRRVQNQSRIANAVSVSGDWRMTFRIEDGETPVDVDYLDYH